MIWRTRYIDFSYSPRARTTISLTQVRGGFVFAPERNQDGKRDASTMFIPKAREFAAYFGFTEPLFFDNDVRMGLGNIRSSILSAINQIENPINVVAYFGHGHDSGLLSAGFRNDSHVGCIPCTVLLLVTEPMMSLIKHVTVN